MAAQVKKSSNDKENRKAILHNGQRDYVAEINSFIKDGKIAKQDINKFIGPSHIITIIKKIKSVEE